MPDGYTKLFSDIVDSSIWDEDAETRVVWVTLLALSNADGFVRGSVGWLAGKAHVSKEVCAAAIKKFTEPDIHSRTPDNDGRRIECLEDGWLILNYLIFRDRLSNTPKAIKTRERVQKHRQRYQALRNTETALHSVTSNHPASASVSKGVQGKGESVRGGLQQLLNKMFLRDESQDWSYEDASLLLTVERRPDHLKEFAAIERYRLKAGRFFPKSVSSLLSGWDKALDAARSNNNHEPGKQSLIEKEVEKQLKEIESI